MVLFGLNGSCWSTARDFLESHCRTRPSILFGQEARLQAGVLGETVAAAARRGWQLAAAAATTGPGGRASAGTFVAVPSSIGITYLDGYSTFDLSPPWG